MRWKTHRHEGSHFRFWQVSVRERWEGWVSMHRGVQSSSSFLRDRVSKCLLHEPACTALYRPKHGSWPTHLSIGVWLKGGRTNALSKGTTTLWDSRHSAAASSAVTLQHKLDSTGHILVCKQNLPPKSDLHLSICKHRRVWLKDIRGIQKDKTKIVQNVLVKINGTKFKEDKWCYL